LSQFLYGIEGDLVAPDSLGRAPVEIVAERSYVDSIVDRRLDRVWLRRDISTAFSVLIVFGHAIIVASVARLINGKSPVRRQGFSIQEHCHRPKICGENTIG
jgi:hypothetical protein